MTNGIVSTVPTARSAGGTLWRRTTGGSFALVALGAAMWGTDPVLRQGLALHMPAPAIVAF